jgi:hypothetical protein
MKYLAMALVSLAAMLVAGTLAAFAHGGPHISPVPYAGLGDPMGLTSPVVATMSMSSSSDTEGYLPYTGYGDPLSVTSPVSRSFGTSAGGKTLADDVRAANARFADVAAAVAEGYGPIPCASGVEGGAMGIHYVNGAYLKDDTVEIGKPEAVMYEPQADGSLELVAVEYITFKGPATLGGQLFSFTGAPNRYGLDPFYELHVWSWRDNPTGIYADMNPNVSCEFAHEHAE